MNSMEKIESIHGWHATRTTIEVVDFTSVHDLHYADNKHITGYLYMQSYYRISVHHYVVWVGKHQ